MGGGITVQSKLGEGTKFTYHVEVGLVSEAQAQFLAVRPRLSKCLRFC